MKPQELPSDSREGYVDFNQMPLPIDPDADTQEIVQADVPAAKGKTVIAYSDMSRLTRVLPDLYSRKGTPDQQRSNYRTGLSAIQTQFRGETVTEWLANLSPGVREDLAIHYPDARKFLIQYGGIGISLGNF